MDTIDNHQQPPQAWFTSIARGEADLAAGRVSDLEPFLRELEAEDTGGAKAVVPARQTPGTRART